MQCFAYVVVNAASLFYGGNDAGEVVIGDDHVGGLFGDLRSVEAHRDADVRTLERWRVIHAITGHCNDSAIGLPCVNDAQFVLGGDACIDGDVRCARAHVVVTHPVQLRAAYCGVVRPGDAKFARDGESGMGMVAGDHDHTNAGIVATRDGLPCLRSWRIVHPGQSDKDKILLKIFRDFVRLGAVWQIAICRAEHAQCPHGHGFVLPFDVAALRCIERHDAGLGIDFGAAL